MRKILSLLLLITLTACGAAGSGGGYTAPAPGSNPTANVLPGTFQIVSGDNQNATVGQALAQPIVFKIMDHDGNPMAGQRIEVAGQWSTVSGVNGLTSLNFNVGTAAGAPLGFVATWYASDGSPIDQHTVNQNIYPGSPVTVQVYGAPSSYVLQVGSPSPVSYVRGLDAYGNIVGSSAFSSYINTELYSDASCTVASSLSIQGRIFSSVSDPLYTGALSKSLAFSTNGPGTFYLKMYFTGSLTSYCSPTWTANL